MTKIKARLLVGVVEGGICCLRTEVCDYRGSVEITFS